MNICVTKLSNPILKIAFEILARLFAFRGPETEHGESFDDREGVPADLADAGIRSAVGDSSSVIGSLRRPSDWCRSAIRGCDKACLNRHRPASRNWMG